jgi:hypothetical protein
MKLTRKQIRESLDSMPMDAVLLGAQGAKVSTLTAKQKAFARELALGETKAGAYRKAYNSKGNSNTASRKGQELAKRDTVRAYTEAMSRALEVQRLQTPAQLRALVVSELTKHAIDETLNPAQRLRALQLLGQVTEVAAFTERREVIKTTDSREARAQLIDSLMGAIKQGATDVDDHAAAQLLAELNAGNEAQTIEADTVEVADTNTNTDTDAAGQTDAQGGGIDSQQGETPPTPTPANGTTGQGAPYA